MLAKCKVCKTEYLLKKVTEEAYSLDIDNLKNDCCLIMNLEFCSGSTNKQMIGYKKFMED